MIELKFSNRDASPKVVKIKTRKSDAAAIVRWYSGFYSGDSYTVHIDGKKATLNYHGELID